MMFSETSVSGSTYNAVDHNTVEVSLSDWQAKAEELNQSQYMATKLTVTNILHVLTDLFFR